VEVENGGFTTITLSDVTVRYWFTNDGNAPATLTFKSYYSQNGNLTITTMVKGTFAAAPPANVTPTSDTYLELSFATGSGMLTPLGGGGANIQVEFNGANTQPPMPFNEVNDYSFDPTKTTTYQPWTHITAYVSGQLVYGCEPQAAASSSSGGGSSSGSGVDDGGSGG
jgi:hypothetical protein